MRKKDVTSLDTGWIQMIVQAQHVWFWGIFHFPPLSLDVTSPVQEGNPSDFSDQPYVVGPKQSVYRLTAVATEEHRTT